MTQDRYVVAQAAARELTKALNQIAAHHRLSLAERFYMLDLFGQENMVGSAVADASVVHPLVRGRIWDRAMIDAVRSLQSSHLLSELEQRLTAVNTFAHAVNERVEEFVSFAEKELGVRIHPRDVQVVSQEDPLGTKLLFRWSPANQQIHIPGVTTIPFSAVEDMWTVFQLPGSRFGAAYYQITSWHADSRTLYATRVRPNTSEETS